MVHPLPTDRRTYIGYGRQSCHIALYTRCQVSRFQSPCPDRRTAQRRAERADRSYRSAVPCPEAELAQSFAGQINRTYAIYAMLSMQTQLPQPVACTVQQLRCCCYGVTENARNLWNAVPRKWRTKLRMVEMAGLHRFKINMWIPTVLNFWLFTRCFNS